MLKGLNNLNIEGSVHQQCKIININEESYIRMLHMQCSNKKYTHY